MELSKIEMNGADFEIKSLIEFSNLAKLLYELSRRQRNLEKKVFGENYQLSPLNIITDGKDRSHKSSSVANNTLTENKNDLNDYEDIFTIEKGATSQEALSKIIKKINDIDKKIHEITNKSNYESTSNNINIKNNKEKIEETIHKMDDTNKNIEYLTKQFSKFNEEFNAIKVKVQEFNIYDIIKGGDSAEEWWKYGCIESINYDIRTKSF